MTAAAAGAHRRAAHGWSAELVASARAAFWPFIVSRAIVLAALVLARFLVTQLHLHSGPAVAAHAGLLGWDANWYRRIALHGYGAAGRSSVRFFPLYPLLARAVSEVPGVGIDVALLLVANVATFAALVLLDRLVRVETGDLDTASRSAWWLAMMPAAFVLSMGYAEPVLLVTSIAMFLALRTRHFAAAAVAGLLAACSRPVGILLTVPALIEVVRDMRETGVRSIRASHLASRVAAVLGAPAGAAAYLIWSKAHDGSFLLPFSAQLSSSRRGRLADPLATIATDARDLVHGSHLGTALHAPWVIVFVALAVVLFSRWPVSYGAYAAVTLAVTLTAPNLTSFERYTLGCFPFALAAATLTRRPRVCWGALAIAGGVLLGYSLLAFLNVYIP